MKSCYSCKWCEKNGPMFSECDHPDILANPPQINVVTGKPNYTDPVYCDEARRAGVVQKYRCGPEGNLWEPHRNIFQKIFDYLQKKEEKQ